MMQEIPGIGLDKSTMGSMDSESHEVDWVPGISLKKAKTSWIGTMDWKGRREQEVHKIRLGIEIL